MYTLLVIFILIAAVLMIGIVLIQESKGGGLASGFSSANSVAGVRQTTNFIEKATRDSAQHSRKHLLLQPLLLIDN